MCMKGWAADPVRTKYQIEKQCVRAGVLTDGAREGTKPTGEKACALRRVYEGQDRERGECLYV
jgi:hypothetical protein